MRGLFKKLQGVESAPLPLSTPDVTKAQVGGWLQFAASVAIGVGVLQPAEGEVLIGASALVATGIHLADAIIRHGRAGAMAALHLNVPTSGTGQMGGTAPEGDDIPDTPTLDGAPEVDVSEDGTGVPLPPDVQAGIDTENEAKVAAQPTPPVEGAPAPQVAAAAPVVNAGPPPPSPQELAQAQADVDAAYLRLADLQARSTTAQQ